MESDGGNSAIRRIAGGVLRALYWVSASVVGVFGLAAWSLDRVTGAIDAVCPDGDWNVRNTLHTYYWFRLLLGCFQIVAHMGVLCPARLSERCSRRVALRIGGRATFYRFLAYCNYAITAMVVLSV